MTITLETRLRRHDGIVYAPVASDGVMLNIDRGLYHSVNEVGARVWELLDSPATVTQLCQRLREEFDVEDEVCRDSVLEFVGKLLDRGMLHVET